MAITRLTGTMISRAVPANRALNSMKSLPSFSELVASKLMFSTISPFFTYSRGTCTVSSTCTATYGVRPLSLPQSYRARTRHRRRRAAGGAPVVQRPDQVRAGGGRLQGVHLLRGRTGLLAHHLLGRREGLDV